MNTRISCVEQCNSVGTPVARCPTSVVQYNRILHLSRAAQLSCAVVFRSAVSLLINTAVRVFMCMYSICVSVECGCAVATVRLSRVKCINVFSM